MTSPLLRLDFRLLSRQRRRRGENLEDSSSLGPCIVLEVLTGLRSI